jgi:hypothetical protein
MPAIVTSIMSTRCGRRNATGLSLGMDRSFDPRHAAQLGGIVDALHVLRADARAAVDHENQSPSESRRLAVALSAAR